MLQKNLSLVSFVNCMEAIGKSMVLMSNLTAAKEFFKLSDFEVFPVKEVQNSVICHVKSNPKRTGKQKKAADCYPENTRAYKNYSFKKNKKAAGKFQLLDRIF
jgi:hypothetical protein